MSSKESSFHSEGVKCAGTLMLPSKCKLPPVIIMAHGFGSTRNARLPAFADRFVEAGYAVYLFDYRCFGDSDGEPRQWVSPKRHLQDWAAAIRHVRELPEIDGRRVVIWGTSLSGGHVLATAAQGHALAAVISQVPHVSGPASTALVPPRLAMRTSIAALRDVVGSALFGKPHYSQIVGHPGELAAMTSPESWNGYMQLIPPGAKWENKMLARVFFEMPTYSPIKTANQISAPTLVIAGEHDTVTPASAARKAAERIPNVEFHMLDCNHFAPYVEPVFESNIAIQLAFLKKHVPITS